jgi:hypothetical protein
MRAHVVPLGLLHTLGLCGRYWGEAVRGGTSASEPAPTERLLTMMQFVARVGPEAFVETGCLDTILMVRPCGAWGGARGVNVSMVMIVTVLMMGMVHGVCGGVGVPGPTWVHVLAVVRASDGRWDRCALFVGPADRVRPGPSACRGRGSQGLHRGRAPPSVPRRHAAGHAATGAHQSCQGLCVCVCAPCMCRVRWRPSAGLCADASRRSVHCRPPPPHPSPEATDLGVPVVVF